MKKFICYLFHDRRRTVWEKWFGNTYTSECRKCGRNFFTQSPELWELNRTKLVVVIIIAVLFAIGYLLKSL